MRKHPGVAISYFAIMRDRQAIHFLFNEIGFRQHGSQTFGLRTEIATTSLWEASQ